jgi:molybdate transport system substrate-binding protein
MANSSEKRRAAMPDNELQILAGGGIADPLDEIIARFERANAQRIVSRYGSLPQLIDMAQRGIPFDLVVVPRDVLDNAAVRALVVPDSIRPVARAGIGVAVPLGQKLPDISTPEALKRTLLAARSVASIPASATGVRIAEIYARLGIVAEMAVRTRVQPAPKQIAEAVARGEADLGLFLLNVLIDPRLTIVGPVPAELQREVVYDTAVAVNARAPDAARAFVAHLLSPEAADVIRDMGMRPG